MTSSVMRLAPACPGGCPSPTATHTILVESGRHDRLRPPANFPLPSTDEAAFRDVTVLAPSRRLMEISRAG